MPLTRSRWSRASRPTRSRKVKAGELVGNVAGQVGGKGGGRPDFAQAGGNNPAALGAALASVEGFVRAKLGSGDIPVSCKRGRLSMTRTIVQKYGGTSVGSVELIQRVAEKVAAVRARGDRIAVVVSAMGDSTDRLVDLAAGIAREPNPREMDVLLSTGEQVSIALLAMALCERGVPARSFTGSQVRVRTTNIHRRARITDVETQRLQRNHRCRHRAGGRGIPGHRRRRRHHHHRPRRLGHQRRRARRRAQGRRVPDPHRRGRRLHHRSAHGPRSAAAGSRLSFEEMLELAGQGSRVLHLRSVEFAAKYNVPLRVLSSFRPGAGTLICKEEYERGSSTHLRHRLQPR